jgi:hypothetical protein
VNLEEARRVIAGTVTTAERARSTAMAGPPVDAYTEAGDTPAGQACRARLIEAMLALIQEGEDWEREMAGGFFGCVVLPADVVRRLVGLYVTLEWTSADPAARFLSSTSLGADDVEALRRVYLADPVRHHRLPEVLLRSDADGAVWRVLAAEVERTEDVQTLLRAFDAVLVAPDRAPDFYALLRRKPQKTIRDLVQRLGPSMRKRVLEGCGLPAD